MENRWQLTQLRFVTTRWRLWNRTEAIGIQKWAQFDVRIPHEVLGKAYTMYMCVCVCTYESVWVCVWCVYTR